MTVVRAACATLVLLAAGPADHVNAEGQPAPSVQLTRNLVYRSLPGWRGTLDIYQPRHHTGPQPTVMYIHGGGGPKELTTDAVVPYLQWGFQVISVEYHWDEAGPIAIEDCRCALRWIWRHQAAYQIDTKRLIVTGNSAGGHLALMVGMLPARNNFDRTCPGDEPLGAAAIINLFGMTDLDALMGDEGAGGRPWVRAWLGHNVAIAAAVASPIHYVRPLLPPILTIHGDADRLVPFAQAVALDSALKAVGADHTLVRIAGGQHGGYWPWHDAAAERETGAITEFLHQHRLMPAEHVEPGNVK